MSSCEALPRAAVVAAASNVDDFAGALIAALEGAGGAAVSATQLQTILTAALKLYAERIQAGERFSPVTAPGAVSATDTLIAVTALLKSANLELFELGMWQSWSGSR